MIFVAYAGTGKSFSAEKLDEVLDMAIVPYKYKFPKDYGAERFSECDKGCVEYVLCYPERGLKDEYLRRYHKRGNSEAFMRIFVDGWDMWIDSFETRPCKKYVMQEGEYLLGVIERCMVGNTEEV